MTEPPKRSRGRPKGSGKDDSALLSVVADLVLTDAIKPTTAMKRLIRQAVQKKTIAESADTATLRRLQEKWAASHETLKAQAQARLDAKKAKAKEEQERRQRRSSGGGGYSSGIPHVGSALADVAATARALGISERIIGQTFPKNAYEMASSLSAFGTENALGKAVEAAGLGGALRDLASQTASAARDFGASAALATQSRACEALYETASWSASSLRDQPSTSLAMSARSQAIEALQQGALYQRRNFWEESREQEALRKMITGTYDPLTGRYE